MRGVTVWVRVRVEGTERADSVRVRAESTESTESIESTECYAVQTDSVQYRQTVHSVQLTATNSHSTAPPTFRP